MIAAALVLLAISLIVLLPAAYLLGRHLHRRQYLQDDLSPVTRQHIDLFQGGQLSEVAVESAKDRFRVLLERGEVEAVEASLRPGTHYVVQVRALTEIGTDDAGRILERQLQRRLTEDQIEQSWYWIDLANGLRSLNREQSLPHLLRCSEQAGEIPLGHFLAAETACFLGFAGRRTWLPRLAWERRSKVFGIIVLKKWILFWCESRRKRFDTSGGHRTPKPPLATSIPNKKPIAGKSLVWRRWKKRFRIT